MNRVPAIVFTNGLLDTPNAKTCHGLIRGSDRFEILAVVDAASAGRDAGEVLDGRHRGIPVVESVEAWFAGEPPRRAEALVVGVAFHGGALPVSARGQIKTAIEHGLGVVCGLHTLLGDDPEFSALARKHGVTLTDVRRPRPTSELHFWDGSIYQVRALRVPVLGTDCALGKRTTSRLLVEACRRAGLTAEMVYTGQTGWMQGSRFGFIFDSTPNDFVSGELERAVVACDRELGPDVIVIEGQSALRNPSGPCGSELLLSAAAHGALLQHAPGREYFDDLEYLHARIPSAEDEVALIRAYGVPVLAVTLNEQGMDDEAMRTYQAGLEAKLGLPVVRPLAEGLDRVVEVFSRLVAARKAEIQAP